MPPVRNSKLSLWLVIIFVTAAFHNYAQTLTGTALELNDPAYGGNSDYTAIFRADAQPDRARLRIMMGDEYTSDFQIGYIFYENGQWYTNFNLDGWGNGYFRGNLGIGTTSLTEALNVNGKIRAEEVQVVVDVPADYVFAHGYHLLPLDEVSKFIQENKHLPNIPSASELKEKGWNVGEMNNKLLEKVEELTLYLLEQQKQIIDLQKEVNSLKAKIKE